MSVGFLVFILNTALGLFTLYKTRTKASIFFSLFAIGFGFWAAHRGCVLKRFLF
jgi:uncharacterized membrane protein HdeD (DUF308 family)